MPRSQYSITADDILPLDQYELIRADKKQEALLRKRFTRLHIGPNATAIFETWDSMWLQIQEMLRIEKGGQEQLVDELAAYDPMVPKGGELTATVLFEVEDAGRRDAFLRRIGGVERHIHLSVAGTRIGARADGDVARTRESDGKTSAVHFVHFDLTPAQVEAWRSGEGTTMIGIDHPEYGHAAVIGADARAYLARECF